MFCHKSYAGEMVGTITYVHHVQNEHEWIFARFDSAYVYCSLPLSMQVWIMVLQLISLLTGPPTDVDGNELKYFARDEKSFKVLQKLVKDEKWLLSMKCYIKFRYGVSICDYKNVRLCLQTHWKARIIPQLGIGICSQVH